MTTLIGPLWILLALGTASQNSQDTRLSIAPVGKTFTLRAVKTPLSEVLRQFQSQTQVAVTNRSDNHDPPLTLNLDGVPFWPALDTIAATAGDQLVIDPRNGRLSLVKQADGVPPQRISYAGTYRMALRRISAGHDFSSGLRSCVATLEVCWEPSLPPLYLETLPRRIQARTSDKRALSAQFEGSSLASVEGRASLTFDIHLPVAARECRRFEEVRGELTVIGPTRMLDLGFGRLDELAGLPADAPRRTLTRDSISCRISEVKLTEQSWLIRVAVDRPPGAEVLESYQSWTANNQLVLVAKDGTRLVSRDVVMENVSPKKAVLTYQFSDQGTVRRKSEDWTLFYHCPAELKVLSLPFAFKEVPLP
jgi:hypothetical protein